MMEYCLEIHQGTEKEHLTDQMLNLQWNYRDYQSREFFFQKYT